MDTWPLDPFHNYYSEPKFHKELLLISPSCAALVAMTDQYSSSSSPFDAHSKTGLLFAALAVESEEAAAVALRARAFLPTGDGSRARALASPCLSVRRPPSLSFDGKLVHDLLIKRRRKSKAEDFPVAPNCAHCNLSRPTLLRGFMIGRLLFPRLELGSSTNNV